MRLIALPILLATIEGTLVLRFFLQSRRGARFVAGAMGLLLLFLALWLILPAMVWGTDAATIAAICVYLYAGPSHLLYAVFGDDDTEYHSDLYSILTGDPTVKKW